MERIEFDTQSTNNEWMKIMKHNLKKAKKFEIHCWNEEIKENESALVYGKIKETGWSSGTVITGAITTV